MLTDQEYVLTQHPNAVCIHEPIGWEGRTAGWKVFDRGQSRSLWNSLSRCCDSEGDAWADAARAIKARTAK